jgi:hypothetical protein
MIAARVRVWGRKTKNVVHRVKVLDLLGGTNGHPHNQGLDMHVQEADPVDEGVQDKRVAAWGLIEDRQSQDSRIQGQAPYHCRLKKEAQGLRLAIRDGPLDGH